MKKAAPPQPNVYEGLEPEDLLDVPIEATCSGGDAPASHAPVEIEGELLAAPLRARSRLSGPRAFVAVWTLAIVATVSAFVLHLALRGKTVALGYELGRAHAEQARLREVKRVLEVEAASYKTPERVEIVARTLLGMEPPAADRIIVLPALPERDRDPSGPVAEQRAPTAPPRGTSP